MTASRPASVGVSDGGRVDVSACSLDISAQEPFKQNGCCGKLNEQTPYTPKCTSPRCDICTLRAWISTVHLHCHPYMEVRQVVRVAIRGNLCFLHYCSSAYITIASLHDSTSPILTSLCSSARPHKKVTVLLTLA